MDSAASTLSAIIESAKPGTRTKGVITPKGSVIVKSVKKVKSK